MQLNLDSKISDIYNHPLGQDIIDKLLLQLGKSDWSISKVGSMRLKTLNRIVGKKIGKHFFNAVLDLLNSEQDVPCDEETEPTPAWWKEAVFYQVYPRSFTREGLKGIYGKLDYLCDIGVNAIWLSPVYDSPNDDNGYDIRDYYNIMQEFGTIRDMEVLIGGIHKRGMKLVMDLVINHTSDEHPWFQEALRNEASPYRDFYFFRKGRGDKPPNNWTSFFGGSAWNYYPKQDIWALHLFSKKQMDLNWESPALRAEIHRMIRWWLGKGVDGFRLDVINYISKYDGLPDGDEFIGELMKYTGVERYFYGPKLHEYLREIKQEIFAPYNAFSVGETPGIGPMAGRLLTDDYREELDLIFSFDHLEAPGMTRFDDYVYDLTHLKNFYIKHLNVDKGHGWHTLFYNNHDNPRMLSKIEPSGEYAEPLAKMLAVLQFTLRGTPFIYQGDEIGTRNENFTSIDEITDVESQGLYKDFLAAGLTPEEAFGRVLAGTRDHARAMIKWDEVGRQQEVYESVWRFYQKIIAWRKKTPACVYGALEFWDAGDDKLFCYSRSHDEGNIFVEVNLTAEIATSVNPDGAMFVLGNYRNLVSDMQPYEARVYVY